MEQDCDFARSGLEPNRHLIGAAEKAANPQRKEDMHMAATLTELVVGLTLVKLSSSGRSLISCAHTACNNTEQPFVRSFTVQTRT